MRVFPQLGVCWLTDRWPREFGEHKFKTYIDWMKSCSLISGLDLPALSVPCGLTAAGAGLVRACVQAKHCKTAE